MPKHTIFVSSQSGKEIADGSAWSARFSGPGEEDYFEADLSAEEAKAVIAATKAEKRAKRGRKPADENGS